MEHIIFTNENIQKCIENLDISKANGPDNISNHLLKITNASITPYLKILFDKIMFCGEFPKSWKLAIVTPIFKDGDPCNPNNYRPISMLNSLSKVFEKLVYEQLNAFLTSNGLITQHQSGFREGDGTINRLVNFVHVCKVRMSEGLCTPTIFLDISKAFDRVYHKGLIHKLKQVGITGNLLNMLTSYISKRKQKVALEGELSDVLELFAGVPQGSVLGPLLFLIFINDILDNIKSFGTLFADDTSIFTFSNFNSNNEVFQLQSDLIKIENWASTWKVDFNASKTEMIIFRNPNFRPININLYFLGKKIPLVAQHKHLGIILDQHFNWKPQIEDVIKKVQLNLNIMKSFKYIFSRLTLKLIYIYHVKSILNYGDVLFGKLPLHLNRLIERIQYQALCTVTGCVYGTSEIKMRLELGWNTLEECRQFHMQVLMYKLVNNLVPNYLIDQLPPFQLPNDRLHHNFRNNTRRNPDNLTISEFHGNVKLINSCLPQAVIAWNSLSLDIRQANSLITFKNKLQKHISLNKIKYFDSGSRRLGALHCQLRLGTSALNSSLYNRNLLHLPNCECGCNNETEKHFLLICPLYNEHRNRLLHTISSLYPNENHLHSLVYIINCRFYYMEMTTYHSMLTQLL